MKLYGSNNYKSEITIKKLCTENFCVVTNIQKIFYVFSGKLNRKICIKKNLKIA